MNLAEALSGKRVAAFIFFALSILFLFPIFSNFGNIGLYDWDQHLFYHGSASLTIKKFGQFPFWNPFHCGGTPLLANPQSTFLSPFFLLLLLFGDIAGLKLQVLAYCFLGLFGMFLLARRLGIRIVQAYVTAIIFMFSSWFAARVLVGHTTFFPFALLPWAFLFYLMAEEKLHWAFAGSVVMALMFLSGGVYPFYFAAMLIGLYALLESLEKMKLRPLYAAGILIAFALLFSAPKLLPVVEFTKGLAFDDLQKSNIGFAVKGLLSMNQGMDENNIERYSQGLEGLDEATIRGELPWGWHEYSAYIGIIPLLLAFASILSFRKNWKLITLALLFFILGLGDFSPIPLWSVLKTIPFIGAIHGPSRFMIMLVFLSAILAGKSLSDIKPLNNKWAVLAVAALVLATMMYVSYPLLSSTFVREPFQIDTGKYDDYIHIATASPDLSQYSNMLQNLDTVNCYERIHPRIRVFPQLYDNGTEFEGFIGNAYIAETNESLSIEYFSPNRVVIGAKGRKGTVVYNQNYFVGWKSSAELTPFNGLVASKIEQSQRITFTYSPASFYIGIAIAFISALAAAFLVKKWQQ